MQDTQTLICAVIIASLVVIILVCIVKIFRTNPF